MFTIDVLTLFPEVFAPFVGLSILGRAVEAGTIAINYHHVLDALEGSERADEPPYGGGPGMVMRIEPLARILDGILAGAKPGSRTSTARAEHASLGMTRSAEMTLPEGWVIVVPGPGGKRFGQSDAERFSRLERLIIVSGHYEGIDERLGALYPIEEYSLGDFVLTGGELPALAMMDATVRLVPGVVNADSLASESFGAEGQIDHPAYTRPPVFRGVSVPEVLLSGDHAAIAAWRRQESRRRSAARKESL